MGLTEAEKALWNRIEEFSLDDDAASFSFTSRLARDNNWGLAYTTRVVEEYKKFMFLSVVAGHPVTPSDQVDQAWHLHLIYTQSYWTEFCEKVLKKPIHHGPTKGGSREREKFTDHYEETKSTYRDKFGCEPPEDIWPESKVRFDRQSYYQRINAKQFWVIRKPDFSRLVSRESFQITAAAAIPFCLIAWSPYNLAGKQFLVFYFCLTFFALLIAYILQRVLTTSGFEKWQLVEQKTKLTLNQKAYLAGGDKRLIQAAVCELIVGGFAKSVGTKLGRLDDKSVYISQKGHPQLSATANLIFKKLAEKPMTLSEVHSACRVRKAKVSGQLTDIGLVQSRLNVNVIRWVSFLIVAGVLLVGIFRLIQAYQNAKPAGYLMFEMILAVVGGAILMMSIPFRTRAGDQVLKQQAERAEGMKQKILDNNSTPASVATLVGILGVASLAGTAWETYHSDLRALMTPISGSGGGDGGFFDTGCGGDSGCSGCGGGCGGCGGCGG